MKNSKKLMVIMGLFLVLNISACSTENTAKNASSDSTSTNLSQDSSLFNPASNSASASKEDILKRVNNDLPCEQLIKTSYPAETILYPATTFRVSSEYSKMIYINEFAPIECLRDAGNGYYYAVYQTTEGGRSFLFFDKANGFNFSHEVYIYKPCKREDYEKLKKGDNLNTVLNMDKAFHSATSKQQASNAVVLDSSPYSYALLKDTFVLIQYEQIGIGESYNNFIISEIQFIDDKKLVVNENVTELQGAKRSPVREVFDFTILPQDYPE